jgi:hypothetical protein
LNFTLPHYAATLSKEENQSSSFPLTLPACPSGECALGPSKDILEKVIKNTWEGDPFDHRSVCKVKYLSQR